jgi:hypothetical protein
MSRFPRTKFLLKRTFDTKEFLGSEPAIEICDISGPVFLESQHLRWAQCFAGLYSFCGELFGVLMSFHGVLMRLFGKLVSGETISLAVSGGSGAVRVSRKIMEFRGSTVHTLWHLILLDS